MDHVAGVKEKTALADTEMSKPQDELSNLRTAFESYRGTLKKKVDDKNAFSSKSQTCFGKFEIGIVQYWVEERYLSSLVDDL